YFIVENPLKFSFLLTVAVLLLTVAVLLLTVAVLLLTVAVLLLTVAVLLLTVAMVEVEPTDEAIYLIEINELVKDFLRQNVKGKLVNGWITGRAALNLETSTGIPIEVPENTPFDDIKQAKKEAIIKFFAKRPWILLPNRENPFPRIPTFKFKFE
ncbi:hypothetical protein TVAGG3_0076060, partial [Trichomonas vaginalis G3]|uniref:hypothetical protein n=1 Tax=Trichomonas vaginalis (strain ATCC PRA-98 / G3) TaxID=412133 RepID=UPI0021E5684B